MPALPEATCNVTDEPPRADCCPAGPVRAPSPWTQQSTELTLMFTVLVPPFTPTEVPLIEPKALPPAPTTLICPGLAGLKLTAPAPLIMEPLPIVTVRAAPGALLLIAIVFDPAGPVELMVPLTFTDGEFSVIAPPLTVSPLGTLT